jgi:LacI family transcriptional regulator
MISQKRITIREIATEAGVSTQTVSRVLNGRPDVAAGTRRKVQKIIDHHKFQPSQIARSLTGGRSWTIGVITSHLEQVGPAHVLSGIAQEAQNLGYQISLGFVSEAGDAELETVLHQMTANRVEGLIWNPVEKGNATEAALFERIQKAQIPLIAGRDPRPGISVVYTDNCLGAENAIRHLVEQGCRRIGHISGPDEEHSARERKRGWRLALQEVGLEAAESLVEPGDWSTESGAAAFSTLKTRHPNLDAIFAANDQMALGLMHAALSQGCRIPEDLSVVGFDNIPESAHFWPALTTVRQDMVENGRLMVQELDRAIASQFEGREYEICSLTTAPRLVVRASSRRSVPVE